MKFSLIVFVLVTAWGLVSPQINSINSIPGSGQTQFFLDRYSDCDGKPREVGQATTSISGFSTETQGKPVTSCTITLNTENIREPYRFKLEFLAVRIGDPLTQLYIYDGQGVARLLWSFSQMQNKPNDLVNDFTTGQMVTFKFSRGEFDKNYDIRIVATPVPSTVNCNYENEYNCNLYGYVHRILGPKEIAAIVGGCSFVVIIIVILIVVYCYCKQRGVTRKWNEEKLGNANLSNSRRPLPSIMSTIPRDHSHYRRNDQYEDDKYSDRSCNSDRKYSEKSYSTKNYSDKSFSEKNYSAKNYRPPTYREAVRHDSESVSSGDEHSFVQVDDTHPQSVFIERVITPRVNKKNNKSAQITVDVDDTYDCNESERKSSKALMVDKEADSQSGEIEESDTDNETEDEETEEEESEMEALNNQTADQIDALYSNPDKTSQCVHNLVGPSQNTGAFRPLNPVNPQMHMSQFQQVTPNQGILPAGVQHPQLRHGFTGQPISYQQGQFSFPQDQSPQISQCYIPQNNLPQPTSYNEANFSVPLQHQQQPTMVLLYNPNSQQQLHERLHKSKRDPPSLAQASSIPVYSHLVNRGYRPVDGRYSPASTSTRASNISGASNLSGDRNVHNGDLDSTANLSSGVELLKRNN